MNTLKRAAGWLLFGVGTVLTGLGMLALAGFAWAQIDVFGIELQTKNDRVVWVIAWLLAAMIGLLMSGAGKKSGDSTP